MKTTFADALAEGIGAIVWCYGPGQKRCEWFTTYLTAQEAVDLFGGDATYEQASRRLRCRKCGQRGRDGRISIRPSTNDMADLRRGHPPGTTEARQGTRRLVDRNLGLD